VLQAAVCTVLLLASHVPPFAASMVTVKVRVVCPGPHVELQAPQADQLPVQF
jgi:hypothetical protein